MEERPISSRMQQLLQRAADERQVEQTRRGESVESLRARVDDLATSVVSGNERLTEKIDATFALTASTVEIMQRLADRVDSLERSLDDITMRLGSISWRMDEVRDGEGRLADRIDESALALAEAMIANTGGASSPGGRPESPADLTPAAVDVASDDGAVTEFPRGETAGDPAGDRASDAPTEMAADETDDADQIRPDADRAPGGDEPHLPDYAASAARFEPQSTTDPFAPPEHQPVPEPDRPYANVVDLPSHGHEPTAPPRPGDEVASGRPLWGPSGDFLGSRPPVAAAADAPTTTVFEFPTESTEPSTPPEPAVAQDDAQDFFDRWGPQREDAVAESDTDPPTTESPVQNEGRPSGRGLNGPPTGQRFLREVSAARESQQAARSAQPAPGDESRATDDTVPPEWFASYFRNDGRTTGQKPAAANSPAPAPLPGGGRPAPGSA